MKPITVVRGTLLHTAGSVAQSIWANYPHPGRQNLNPFWPQAKSAVPAFVPAFVPALKAVSKERSETVRVAVSAALDRIGQ